MLQAPRPIHHLLLQEKNALTSILCYSFSTHWNLINPCLHNNRNSRRSCNHHKRNLIHGQYNVRSSLSDALIPRLWSVLILNHTLNFSHFKQPFQHLHTCSTSNYRTIKSQILRLAMFQDSKNFLSICSFLSRRFDETLQYVSTSAKFIFFLTSTSFLIWLCLSISLKRFFSFHRIFYFERVEKYSNTYSHVSNIVVLVSYPVTLRNVLFTSLMLSISVQQNFAPIFYNPTKTFEFLI